MSYLTISQQTLADTAFCALMLMKREKPDYYRVSQQFGRLKMHDSFD